MYVAGVSNSANAAQASMADARQKSDEVRATFSAALTEAAEASPPAESSPLPGASQVNFTDMTRKELADWVNVQIRNGEMSFEESFPFISMALTMPVNGEYAGLDDREHVNFVEKALGGMEFAQDYHDIAMYNRLQAALTIMADHQVPTSRFDLSA